MSTGIVSLDLEPAGRSLLSWALLAAALLTWLVLAAAFVVQLVADRRGWTAAARSPAALTGVAATAVIGTAFARLHWVGIGWLLLVAAAGLWLVLLPIVLAHWSSPTTGASFLACVATQSIVILAATQVGGHRRGIAVAAVAGFAVGLALYLMVFGAFDWGQLRAARGNHWILAGALSISSLAGALLAASSRPLGLRAGLRTVALALCLAALLAFVVLLAAELLSPRLAYHPQRWATVFPVGMTAAATSAVGHVSRLPWLLAVAAPLTWVAAALWAVVTIGGLRSWLGARLQPAVGHAGAVSEEAAGRPTVPAPPGGPGQPAEPAEGGDAACWAHLLCPACGAVLDDAGHRPGCPAAGDPGDPGGPD